MRTKQKNVTLNIITLGMILVLTACNSNEKVTASKNIDLNNTQNADENRDDDSKNDIFIKMTSCRNKTKGISVYIYDTNASISKETNYDDDTSSVEFIAGSNTERTEDRDTIFITGEDFRIELSKELAEDKSSTGKLLYKADPVVDLLCVESGYYVDPPIYDLPYETVGPDAENIECKTDDANFRVNIERVPAVLPVEIQNVGCVQPVFDEDSIGCILPPVAPVQHKVSVFTLTQDDSESLRSEETLIANDWGYALVLEGSKARVKMSRDLNEDSSFFATLTLEGVERTMTCSSIQQQ